MHCSSAGILCYGLRKITQRLQVHIVSRGAICERYGLRHALPGIWPKEAGPIDTLNCNLTAPQGWCQKTGWGLPLKIDGAIIRDVFARSRNLPPNLSCCIYFLFSCASSVHSLQISCEGFANEKQPRLSFIRLIPSCIFLHSLYFLDSCSCCNV
jgi:hypothetical protein